MGVPMNPDVGQSPRRFARIVGSPGTRLRLLGLLRALWPMALVMVAFGYLIRAAVPYPFLSPSTTGLLFLTLAAVVAGTANISRDRLQNTIKGAQGEESVARRLALLPAQWTIFHGIAVGLDLHSGGGADIDHVVIGPNGVFVIETKNWSGAITAGNNTLLCDGEVPDRDPLDQVKALAAALRERLLTPGSLVENLQVIPVLCFCGGTILKNITGLADVIICTEERLCSILQNHPESHLSAESRQSLIRYLENKFAPTDR